MSGQAAINWIHLDPLLSGREPDMKEVYDASQVPPTRRVSTGGQTAASRARVNMISYL